MANDVRTLVDHLGWGHVHVVGPVTVILTCCGMAVLTCLTRSAWHLDGRHDCTGALPVVAIACEVTHVGGERGCVYTSMLICIVTSTSQAARHAPGRP